MATNPFAKYLTSDTSGSTQSNPFSNYLNPSWVPPVSIVKTPTPTKAVTTKKLVVTPTPKQTGLQQTGDFIKKIGNDLQMRFVEPKNVQNIKKLEKKPLVIKPNQTKLNSTQLQQLQGTQATSATLTPQAKTANVGQNLSKQFPETIKQSKNLYEGLKPKNLFQPFNDPIEKQRADIKRSQEENRKIAKQVWEDTKINFKDFYAKGVQADKTPMSGEKIIRNAETLVAAGKTALTPLGILQTLVDTPLIGKVIQGLNIPFTALHESKVFPTVSKELVNSLPVSNQVKKRILPVVTDGLDLASQIALGHFLNIAGKKAFGLTKEVGSGVFEKLTKNVIDESGSPKVINFSPSDIKDINLGKAGYEAQMIKELGLSSSEWRNAVKNGLRIEIPAEKIARIVDKPYWEKIKKVFDVQSTEKVVTPKNPAKPQAEGSFGGYLTEGEKTPQQVIGEVIKSGQENTPQGKELIKSAIEARNQGRNIMIEKPAGQISPDTVENVRKYMQHPASALSTETVKSLKANPIGVDELKFDANGNITVYRDGGITAGKPTSFSLKKMMNQVPITLNKSDVLINTTSKKLADLYSENYPGKEKEIYLDALKKWNGLESEIIAIAPEARSVEEFKSLLQSDAAKEAEADLTRPKVEKAKTEIQKIEEDIAMRRQENEAKKSILEQFTGDQIKSMRIIKTSMESRENKGKDATTVEQLPTYQKNIHDVMSAIGTNSTDEALRFIREDLPEPLVNASTKAELEQIKVLKSHITPKEATAPKQQLPVGEGKLKASKLEARVKGVMGKVTEAQIEDLGVSTYQEMNKKETIAKAAEYVTQNPQEALDVIRGKIEAPKGLIPEAIYIALTEHAVGDLTLGTKLASLQATALGQRISILSELNKDSAVKVLNEVYKIRAEEFKKTHGGKSAKEVVKAYTNKVKIEPPKLSDWGSLIKEVRC